MTHPHFSLNQDITGDQLPRRRMSPVLLAFVAAIAIVAGISAIIALSGAAQPKIDVKMTGCTAGALESVTTDLRVHNASRVTQTVRVALEFRDVDGNRVDTDTAVVRSLAAGDTATVREVTMLGTSQTIGCYVTDVSTY